MLRLPSGFLPGWVINNLPYLKMKKRLKKNPKKSPLKKRKPLKFSNWPILLHKREASALNARGRQGYYPTASSQSVAIVKRLWPIPVKTSLPHRIGMFLYRRLSRGDNGLPWGDNLAEHLPILLSHLRDGRVLLETKQAVFGRYRDTGFFGHIQQRHKHHLVHAAIDQYGVGQFNFIVKIAVDGLANDCALLGQ
nr:MAG TPA: hypothetical protein [Caudoviricetes sp.]